MNEKIIGYFDFVNIAKEYILKEKTKEDFINYIKTNNITGKEVKPYSFDIFLNNAWINAKNELRYDKSIKCEIERYIRTKDRIYEISREYSSYYQVESRYSLSISIEKNDVIEYYTQFPYKYYRSKDDITSVMPYNSAFDYYEEDTSKSADLTLEMCKNMYRKLEDAIDEYICYDKETKKRYVMIKSHFEEMLNRKIFEKNKEYYGAIWVTKGLMPTLKPVAIVFNKELKVVDELSYNEWKKLVLERNED